MSDPYHEIYTGEIFQKSQCIWHENTLLDFFRSNLLCLGYTSDHHSKKVWRKGNQTVVVCLADDFATCSENYAATVPYKFDRNTVIITDNHVNVPTQYTVCQLPESFFGIYSHTPALDTWTPTRRFNFAVNRIDVKRLLMFLEMQLRATHIPGTETLDYVNFNCWSWDGDNSCVNGLRANFKQQFYQLPSQLRKVYQDTYDHVLQKMPLRNHTLSQEQAHGSAWMNIVMETYSSDTTVALSEKTFRAITLPVPWILYAGQHAIVYLRSLGFDVLHDVIEHRYDNMQENCTAEYGDKMVDFLFEGVEAVQRMQTTDIQQRCQQAAATNQSLLARMQQQWPADFAAWWPTVVAKIQ